MTDLLILQAKRIQETNPELTFEECKQVAADLILEWETEDIYLNENDTE
jgi:hypothetical protein